MYFFLLSYSILGAGIKFIDAAYDEKTFSKKIALLLAPFLGGLWTYTMFINPFSATILLAILLGVIFKGKIDNIAHLSGIIIIFPFIIILGINLFIIPLLFLSLAAILDEIGNDYFCTEYKKTNQKKTNQMLFYFFDQRWMLKASILFLSLIGLIPFYFFIAIICFDYSYLAVRFISKIKQDKRNDFDLMDIKEKSLTSQKIPSES